MTGTRRNFIQLTLATAVPGGAVAQTRPRTAVPWYLRTYRWGQTNITEKDPLRYDIAWWREHWKRTEVQGVIVNAGGIVAYYPSRFPLHYRAQFLGGRDLFGELAQAAHQDGLVVMARMDSNRTAEEFYRAHPGWFAVDAEGKPYRAADKYIACINSPYYDEYLPGVLREIIERSRAEGITDNSWAGLDRGSICYCSNCDRKFRAKTGLPIPRRADWDDPAYRQWILWSYERRTEVWDLNNRTTQAAGGPGCIWSGMNSGSVSSQARSFRDLKEICGRAHILLLDHQRRDDATGFQQNSDTGMLIHGLLGWDKLAPESMAMYQAGPNSFRVASKPAPEARMWMIAGIAGGIQPWWHHVAAYHEDRRMYRTAEPVMRWHKANEQYLVNRRPVASVGVVWSQRNTDFYGRNHASDLVDLPYRGFTQALLRARIPYLPLHADHIDRDGASLAVLILPNVAALSGEQCAAIRRFVERGGSLIATGASTLYSEWGDPREDFALADLFRAHATGTRLGASEHRKWASGAYHTYLRLSPELRARVYGPKAGDEPAPSGDRHPVLRGFDETDLLPYGGMLDPVRTDPGVVIPMTFVPPFPVYPPETAWMREPKTTVAGLVLSTHAKGGAIAYLPADLDRRYAKDHLPDHANLLANLVRWAAGERIPLHVEGAGLIDCRLYQQPGRLILHLVNLTNAAAWRAPIDELIPVGPLKVKVKLPDGVPGRSAKLLVSAARPAFAARQGWATFELPSVLDHEVVVIS
ncbi:MAG: Tat pathway signal protein [Acidobacteria bacterium]|nr:Tat pathway signal protein [Acidobacteriota bacterium]